MLGTVWGGRGARRRSVLETGINTTFGTRVPHGGASRRRVYVAHLSLPPGAPPTATHTHCVSWHEARWPGEGRRTAKVFCYSIVRYPKASRLRRCFLNAIPPCTCQPRGGAITTGSGQHWARRFRLTQVATDVALHLHKFQRTDSELCGAPSPWYKCKECATLRWLGINDIGRYVLENINAPLETMRDAAEQRARTYANHLDKLSGHTSSLSPGQPLKRRHLNRHTHPSLGNR